MQFRIFVIFCAKTDMIGSLTRVAKHHFCEKIHCSIASNLDKVLILEVNLKKGKLREISFRKRKQYVLSMG